MGARAGCDWRAAQSAARRRRQCAAKKARCAQQPFLTAPTPHPPHPPPAADSHAPTWAGNLDGQANLRDAVRGAISFTGPNGKQYRLRDDGKAATLLVR